MMRAIKLLGVAVMMLTVVSEGRGQTIDEVYKKTLSEGGTLNLYGTLAQINAETILPAFEKRFPGIKVNHVDATADQLAARVIAEARGGRVLADIFQTLLDGLVHVKDQGLFLDQLYPEADAFPKELKGTSWVASDLIYIVPAWNTTKVKKEEEPKQFEDFADARWKNRIIAEPRDFQLLIGLSRYKYKSDEKAIALLKRVAANNPEFHKGHSQLAELLVAGQAAACVTCYAHHYPIRKRKGAPVDYMLSEGTGDIDATAILKNAPHPNTALLFARWTASEEGQKVYAQGCRLPAHPKVEPVEKTRPAKVYPVGENDVKDYPKYEKIWKEIFGLR
ncbi:MAG TPA: extracellular solute-binding protein [Candidatus Eisenbacteria bacterium]|nr:extracellular solute-binding protein [Candidatus Eisenbacteria bacterium]